MILVKVRDADGESESLLGEFPPEQLPALVDCFRRYPMYMLGDCTLPNEVEGQFMEADNKGGRAYFEIVLQFDDAS